MKKTYAPAYKHDPIMSLFDKVYWVDGSVRMAPSMYMNRNMVIIKEGDTLFLINPDHLINEESVSPIKNSEFYIFSQALFPESALYLKDIKLLITTDSIQYWTDWHHMSVTGKMLLWAMGFRTKLFIGKPWLKKVTPKHVSLKNNFESLLNLKFEHLIGAHGKPLMGCAHEKVRDLVKMEFD
jgi:hypothetical protein